MKLSLVAILLGILFIFTVFENVESIKRGTFKHILIVNFENEWVYDALQVKTWRELAIQGKFLNNYFAVTHPSQPNYIAQVTGSTQGVHTDSNHDIDTTSVVDLLEKKGLTWRAYMENYPTNGKETCYTPAHGDHKLYYRKHNPFMSVNNIRNNPARCKCFYNEKGFQQDVEAAAKGTQLPNLMYYTPNINNDGHNTNLTFSGNWLFEFLPPLLNNTAFMKDTLIVATFDEDDYTHNNQVYTCLWGNPNIIGQVGTSDNTKYDHYSLLRTIEDNFELGTLGRYDDSAISFKIPNA